MTQIVSVITKDYALLASDRRLTVGEGPRLGELVDDDACKLVSLYNTCGIGYSGLARIEGKATHEWIATTLASANCRGPAKASQVLAERAGRVLASVPVSIRRQIFLIAGWELFTKPPGLRSFFSVITNALDESGQALAQPRALFDCRVRALHDGEELLWYVIGQPLPTERSEQLERNLRRLVEREIGPKEALRLLVDEIVNTSVNEKCKSVGSRVLGFCIPRRSVELQMQSGSSRMVAKQPGDDWVTFAYFQPTYNELQQYGPTFVCGEHAAVTDVKTENDPTRDFQSSEFRILCLPKRVT
jgi:hypothetical protein